MNSRDTVEPLGYPILRQGSHSKVKVRERTQDWVYSIKSYNSNEVHLNSLKLIDPKNDLEVLVKITRFQIPESHSKSIELVSPGA